MSTAQKYLYFDNTSAANFRQWGEGISAQLTTAGWTKTADTGQVDWTSDPAVPAAGSYVYEIREPASDALQTGATAYYIKIEYGTKATNCPQIRISIGTGTNGAGTLTGYTTTATVAGNTTAGQTALGAVGYGCSFAWDTSRLGMCLWRGTATANNCSIIAFERTKNTDGTDSSDGVTVILSSGGTSSQSTFQQTIVFGIGFAVPMNKWGVLSFGASAGTGGTDSFNNSIGISPVFPNYGGFGNPQTVVGTMQLDAGVEGAFYETTLYGSTRTYLCTKQVSSAQALAGNTAALMRFD